MLYSSSTLAQPGSFFVPVLFLSIAASCAGDRTPLPVAASGAREDASVPTASSSGASDAGESDVGSQSAVVDAGPDSANVGDGGTLPKADAQVADAGKASAPSPLVLKGVRKCSAEELGDNFCTEGKRTGMCLDGYCVTEPVCPRYCSALAVQAQADCGPVFDVKECLGVPECLQVRKEALAVCAKLRTDIETGCLRMTCPNIRVLPPP